MRHDKWNRITDEAAKLFASHLENLARTEKWKPEGSAMLEAARKIKEIIDEPEPEPPPFIATPAGMAGIDGMTPFEELPCDHQDRIFGRGGPIRWNPYKKIFMCFLCGAEFVEKKDEPTQEKAGD